eukprot:TRINITY_DN1590_c0_g1_i1.p1 TRINITY_DN1590_c0_g1~~TRINITY_DN1590_c0_g1_i1.p1  ORF type:complete len:223 (+),score=77.41 TRINITY_DN1590_c0_g1_i1:434-1102(+)
MVLFDTVFIAPLNQVMWLTFSTVAGGIYFHEFENAHTLQWMALICGMILNYVGLYYLVPTAADQPIVVINMEKPPNKIKKTPHIMNKNKKSINRDKPKRKRIESDKSKTNVIITSNKGQSCSYPYDGYDSVHDREHETDDDLECDTSSSLHYSMSSSSTDEVYDTEYENEYATKHLHIDIENDENTAEQMPLLNGTSSNRPNMSTNNNNKHKWYQFFAAKRR